MFVLIWVSYMMTDACAEIFGSLFGRQSIQVWGVGDVNRKSLVGVVAGFLGAFVVGLVVVLSQGLGLHWVGLTFVIALVGSLVELYSPRGTDDFTMTTTNALICLAFGLWVR
jgi:dolichol kinase